MNNSINIPNLSIGPFTDEKGHLTAESHGVLSQLITQLQNNFSQEGYRIPQQPKEMIEKLNTDESISATLYNTEHKELNANIDGSFKTVPVVTYDPITMKLTFTVQGNAVTIQGIP